jgi:hypothetical protein
MIIGFGGRMKSGKSTLSKELEKRGFIKIAFADYLKQTISKLYDIDIEKLQTKEGKEEILSVPLKWNNDIAKKLFDLTKINNYKYDIENKKFTTRRECLQYIGTDILRKYDNEFHIKKTLEGLDLNNKNYVCEDFRYKNELNALKQYGAICYYIIRPNNFDISNHISEVSLSWKDFDNIIINNLNEKKFIKKFTDTLEYIGNSSYKPETRKNHLSLDKKTLIKYLNQNEFNTTKAASKLKCSRDKIVWWCRKYGIDIQNNTHSYKYDQNSFLKATPEAAYFAGLLSADGCIKKSGKSKYNYVVELSSNDKILIEKFKKFIKSDKSIYSRKTKNGNINYYFVINSPYIVENIKFWNLKPRKSKYNEIPDIIKNNNDLMKFWILGLIDGDGSVWLKKKGNVPNINILASKQIVDYISNMFSHIQHHISQEKGIENLYNMRFSGKYAICFYNEIYNPIALQRKWNKLKVLSKNKVIK